jgi:hypothetical protein
VFVDGWWRDSVGFVQFDNTTPPDCSKSLGLVRWLWRSDSTRHTPQSQFLHEAYVEWPTINESRIRGIAIQHDAAAMLC